MHHPKRGDHICATYATTAELASEVAGFLADGLRQGERCWYVAAGPELGAIRGALKNLDVDVARQTARAALKLISGNGAYIVHGAFNAEVTIDIFNNAIEQAYTDGFTGFRAAAEMSWALDCEDGTTQLLTYEALLRSLFSTCRAIGLCLYDRRRMPLAVINGALAVHPVAGRNGRYRPNPFYDATSDGRAPLPETNVLQKLKQLDRVNASLRSGS